VDVEGRVFYGDLAIGRSTWLTYTMTRHSAVPRLCGSYECGEIRSLQPASRQSPACSAAAAEPGTAFQLDHHRQARQPPTGVNFGFNRCNSCYWSIQPFPPADQRLGSFS